MLLLLGAEELFQLINRTKLHGDVRIGPRLLRCHVKHGVDVLRFDIHLQRVLGFVDDHALGIPFAHVGLEIAV